MHPIEVDLQIACQTSNVPALSDFQQWADTVLRDMSKPYEVCIRIVDKVESQSLNHQYRHKDKPTNVLSFSYGEESLPLLGDLVICAEIVAEEAKAQEKNELAHWAHLTIHGILHLLGYDHESADEANIMENKEIELLAKIGFTNPYKI